jgi:Ca-activated chloride channel family protein
MRRLFFFASLALATAAHPQSGVLLPADSDQPNPAVLSLEEMNVNIVIDNGDARVYETQIFANHGEAIQEGTYIFALPTGSTVSDFATWDGPVRIPAVILERKRADEVYDEARAQAIDPGLLEAGERDGSDPKADSTFTAKISPIPAYGTKRLEFEYHQRLAVDRLMQGFVLPLVPAQYQPQTAAHLRIHFELHSTNPITGFQLSAQSLPLKFTQQGAHTITGTWEGANVALTQDLSTAWKLDPSAAGTLMVSTFRNPHPVLPSPDQTIPAPVTTEPGFFLAQTLIAPAAPASTQPGQPRNVVLLLDTSLSMQWDKLERSYAALEAVLLSLRPEDHFSLLLFNQDVSSFQPVPTAAAPASVQQALQFVKSSRLRGGTDLGKALSAALAQATAPNTAIYLFSDGNSDRGATILPRKIVANYTEQWKQSSHPRLNIFAVGDDANLPLLRMLAQNDGLLENVLSSEPVEPKLGAFLNHSTSHPVSGLRLDVSPSAAIHTIYTLDDSVYAGSLAEWVGDYLTPAQHVSFAAQGNNGELHATAAVDLPVESLSHPQLPRLWAQARVNALLEQIAQNGETRAAIDEIIALSRRYKFVTPYTSFLAVPRSLLRPRIIRPGDPVLRVHTDPSIVSVIALFPFGLEKPLRHLAAEDVTKGPDSDRLWETRFLAPTDMQDGTYTVRLILRDIRGNTYAEEKTFVIASTPPSVRITLDRTRYHRGDVMRIKAGATATTRTLTARLQGAGATAGAFGVTDLRWNSAAAASTGELQIPSTIAPGSYTLSVTAEDVAHNVGSQEVRIDVVP